MSEAVKAVRGYVTGKVQGVWFRYSVQQKALPLGVCGYAKNLPDGRVEVLLCGEAKNLAEVQKFVSTGPEQARVDNLQWQEVEAEPLTGFDIF
ncbi:acylphosphatase [bacterium SCSIO 12696]|nr:acylphosphatase [bacterium SCSIO 12696]